MKTNEEKSKNIYKSGNSFASYLFLLDIGLKVDLIYFLLDHGGLIA